MCSDTSGRDSARALLDAAAASLSADDPDEVLRSVLDGTPAGVAIVDVQLRYCYVNPALARMTGVPAADLVGRCVGEEQPGIGSSTEVLLQVLRDGQPRESTTGGHPLAGSSHGGCQWHRAYHRLEVDDSVVGVVCIVLEAADSLQEQHELEQAHVRLALLDDAAGRIGTTLDIDNTCEELADFLVPLLADLATVEVLPAGPAEGHGPTRTQALQLRRTAWACVPALRSRAQELGLAGESVGYQKGSAIQRCLETGHPIVQNLLAGDESGLSPPDAEGLAAHRAAGIHSTLVVPLAARGHAIGTVSLARAGDTPGFTDEDVVIIQDLVGRAAMSIDNARRYTHSQKIALELQRALLAEPGSPHPNLELASRYLPSGTSAMVGGDWFETVRLAYGRTLLVMGDVMGHGVEAAVDMSSYRSMLRYVSATDLPPHRILRQLDAMISENESGRPATCLLALADPARGRCTYSSAGHLPPAVFAADGDTELVDVPTGPPLGTGFGGYELFTGAFRPGQVLLLYTDGLVERRGEDIDASLARLAGLRLPVAGDLDELLDEILDGLMPQAAEDDISLLAARVRRRPADRESGELPG
ncbi:SpoIIE family protein phosphatase [Kitasatospora sp. GP82]|uniref:SpoIIE family protein phosphatase n=1 Tax=Kitasatospora sp. GP82 TaxID=3035089 RepID=UPI002474FB1F|nr:SpoIIE family protein phosphatase [Kitasatospora sp. GP82]MDH6128063.1 serine phosphatase RsbU (regulator of sigma subunit) [Kitasatospora sp. GP82]